MSKTTPIDQILSEVESLGSKVPKHARNIHHHLGKIGNEHATEDPDFESIRKISTTLSERIENVWTSLPDETKGNFKRLVTNKCCAVLDTHRGYPVLAADHEELVEKHFEILEASVIS